MTDLSKAEINNLLNKWLKQALTEDEEHRLTGKAKSESEHMALMVEYPDAIAQAKADLSYSDPSRISGNVDNLLSAEGITLDSGSLSYKALCREMLRKQVQLLEILEHREEGDYDFEEAPKSPGASFQADNKPTETLTEVIKHYSSEANAGWTEKSKAEIVDDSLMFFVEVMGDVPMQSIDRRAMNEFKQTIRKLPPNRNKLLKYRKKTIKQLVRMDIEKTLSETTINKHLGRIGTLFDYAITNGFYDGPNPALKIQLPTSKSAVESRAPFDADDLNKLFRSDVYLNDEHLQPYQFWTPIIALFTGMRQNEIAQLYLDDIKEEGGIWFFDVNNDAKDKKLKTKAAKRKVPLHSFLAKELRLPDYSVLPVSTREKI